jgi:hypothetical protein
MRARISDDDAQMASHISLVPVIAAIEAIQPNVGPSEDFEKDVPEDVFTEQDHCAAKQEDRQA